MADQTPPESPAQPYFSTSLNTRTSSITLTPDDNPLPAEASSSSRPKTSHFILTIPAFPRHGPFAIRRESVYIISSLNAYSVILSATWRISHYEELNSVSILLESLLATFLTFILATHRYQDQDWTARPNGAITPWSYYCLGNWIALLNFCCILISGHINLHSRPETPI
jgi:hypothetical protein